MTFTDYLRTGVVLSLLFASAFIMAPLMERVLGVHWSQRFRGASREE